MNRIHLVRTSAFSHNDYAQCVDILQSSDTIVLLDDGCYNLGHPLTNKALNVISSDLFYVIGSHKEARALTDENVNTITMNELVNLIAQSSGTITWQ